MKEIAKRGLEMEMMEDVLNMDTCVGFPYVSKWKFLLLSFVPFLYFKRRWMIETITALNRYQEDRGTLVLIRAGTLGLREASEECTFFLSLKRYAEKTIGESFRMSYFYWVDSRWVMLVVLVFAFPVWQRLIRPTYFDGIIPGIVAFLVATVVLAFLVVGVYLPIVGVVNQLALNEEEARGGLQAEE